MYMHRVRPTCSVLSACDCKSRPPCPLRPQLFGEQLDQEALRDVLLACLGASSTGGIGTSGSKQAKGGLQALSEEEVEEVAALVLERLAGVQGESEEGEGEEGEGDKQQQVRIARALLLLPCTGSPHGAAGVAWAARS